MRTVATIAALALFLGACTTGRGHPVRLDAPRIPDAEWPLPAPDLPEPGPLAGDDALDALLAGLEGLRAHLMTVRARATTERDPAFVRLAEAERSVLRRYRGVRGPGGPVRDVAVVGTAGYVPLAPAATAALVNDPEIERQVLAAQTFKRIGTAFALPGHRRDRYRVDKLRVGVGPFRYDLRFAVAIEQVDLGDGRIAVRSDPVATPWTQGVSLYRGVLLIEPDGSGSRVTEIIVFATQLGVAPPFDQLLKKLVYDTFRHRSTNLWRRAWAPR